MKKTNVFAYYFPNWHPTARNDVWHGKGWTEWEVVKHASPRFEGHKQPKIPLWGYEDESKIEVMEKKIEAAASHGLDGFIFDWYWFEDGSYRIDCLDKAFLGAKNNTDLKFAVMWANHDPIYVHPASRVYTAPPLMSGDISPEAFLKATDHCINTYFTQPNYFRIDGKAYFGFFNFMKLRNHFGGDQATRLIFDDFRRRAKEAGVGELHIDITIDAMLPAFQKDKEAVNNMLKTCGIDSCSCYGSPRDTNQFPKVPYNDCITASVKAYETNAKLCDFPCYINVSSGWDSSPRTVPSEGYDNIGYPFCNIIHDSTPELFEEFLKSAKKFSDSKEWCKVITIFAWNEWTEGGYLEPDDEYGYRRLEAIKRVFSN